jgi:hypothetical protein
MRTKANNKRAPEGQTVLVTATKVGYHNGRVLQPGDLFRLPVHKKIGKWMELVTENTAKAVGPVIEPEVDTEDAE